MEKTLIDEMKKLNYRFGDKPLLIGGMAMEFYGLRKTGADIDFVVSERDHECLKALFPGHIKDLYGDIGICEFKFEIWNTICRYSYVDLKYGAIEREAFMVISMEKLLFLKAIAIQVEKYKKDVELLTQYIMDVQYGEKTLPV